MRLLLDMNLSQEWVDALRTAGLDAIHWSDLGDIEALDPEIMGYALRHGMVVLTRDLDFGMMLIKARMWRPSVVQLRGNRATPEAMSALVVAELRRSAASLDAGCLLTITHTKTRTLLLPFRTK